MYPTNDSPSRFSFTPQTTAWLVVSISFVVFCIVCAASTFGAYWFIFESDTPLTVRLTVSRGTVTMILPDQSKDVVTGQNVQENVQPGTQFTTDSDSQAYLSFEDGYSKQELGSVFLLENSAVRLDTASRPRFEWSAQYYRLSFSGATGHFSADITHGLQRPVMLTVDSKAGTAYMGNGGIYNVEATDQYIRLYPESANGILYASPSHAVQVSANMLGTLYAGEQDPVMQPYPYLMLNLENPGPPQNSFFGTTADPDKLANQWGCTNDTPENLNEPEGVWERAVLPDQSSLLHIFRHGPNLKHAETSCEFWFPRSATDVTGYQTLSIRLKMKIDFQDVPTCGVKGSECPVMLMLEYKDPDENVHQWRQGFYAIRPSGDTSVPRCDTCPHDHVQINSDAWYIYDSGDLKVQFTPDKMPATLIRVSVYSSGHQFDVAVENLAVLGGTGEVAAKAGG